jgi:maltose O-acetyltransferase
MLQAFKHLFWEWRDRIGRFNLVFSLIRNAPGVFGMTLRSRYASRFFAACGQNLKIHEGVRFRGVHRIKAGDDVEIGVENFLQASGGLILGNDVMLGPGVKIWTINHRFQDTTRPIREQGYDYEEVIIGHGVWIGANVFIMPGVQIPDGCVISANSVVAKKKYPPYSIIAGYPARVLGNRSTQRDPKSAGISAPGEDTAGKSPSGEDTETGSAATSGDDMQAQAPNQPSRSGRGPGT